MSQHLLSIDDLGRSGIEEIHELSDRFLEVTQRRIPKVPALRGKTIAWLFWEDSTRTRLSFETAAKRLSADTLNFSVSSSSVNKGESLRDTVETITAMGIDAIVVRHRSAGVPQQITQWTDATIINAGDGWRAHPTQALLDSYTIKRHIGSLEGLKIAIVGDVKHSRVARSNLWAFVALGAEVTFVAPNTLLPAHIDHWPVAVRQDLDNVLGESDVVYLLRMQLERQNQALVPSLREYTERFGLTKARADALNPETLIMHPGPMNRGVEIAGDVPDLPNAVITNQVANGVVTRMALLYKLLAPAGTEPLPDAAIGSPS
jgi:aspartate carbamoyltransferase catalytic subunit